MVHHVEVQRAQTALVLSGRDRRGALAVDRLRGGPDGWSRGRRRQGAPDVVQSGATPVGLGAGSTGAVHDLGGPATPLRAAHSPTARDPAGLGDRAARSRIEPRLGMAHRGNGRAAAPDGRRGAASAPGADRRGALGALAAAATVAATAGVLAGIAVTRRWSALPAAMAGVAAIVLLAVQFGALAGRRPEAVEQMARAVAQHRGQSERVGPYRVFVRNLLFYTRLPQEDLFDEASAVSFLQSTDRVLLVVRPSDLTQ